MTVIEVPDSATFAKHVQTKGKLIVVDFYATCPCKAIAPFVDQLSSKYGKEATFLKVDVDRMPDVSQAAGVTAMPSFGFYGDGRLVELQRGGDPRALEDKIKKYAAQFHKSAFTGSGYTLGAPGAAAASPAASSSSSSSAAATSRPNSATSAPAAVAGDAKPAAAARKNPWANPDFFPGKKPAGGAAAAAPSSTTPAAAKPPPSAAPSSTPSTPSSAAAPSARPAAAESAPVAQPPAASAPAPPAAAPSSSSASTTPASGSASSAATPALPPVNAALLQQMLDMGFSQVRAEKALLLTHNTDAEVAVGWLMEHQDDADIDEPLQVVGSAPASRSSNAAGQSDVNLDELDEDGRVLYEDMMRKKAKEQQGVARGGGGGGSTASSSVDAAARGASRVSAMSSEEKMQWLADKRAQVKAKKEAEALEKVKTDFKANKGMTSALNELKEQREEHERQTAMAAKKKEAADKEKQRRQIAERLAADKERRRKEQEKTMQQLQKAKEEKEKAGK